MADSKKLENFTKSYEDYHERLNEVKMRAAVSDQVVGAFDHLAGLEHFYQKERDRAFEKYSDALSGKTESGSPPPAQDLKYMKDQCDQMQLILDAIWYVQDRILEISY